ncbi:MAG TPA: CcoQ/FixQ family Cbb3-type cytochrome c oxidase assembly chaperone [Xanthomonadaceae bacterium]|jgi:cbb3-type cytochrome oxidase subunit 3|nr:CcoQ/FixQ family Cbb3-type cytochrome c oxidase assembly chaperone [Xanthomonadaceae bacterium]
MSHGFITAFLLAAFIGGIFWLFAVRRAADFDRLARIPLDDEPGDSPLEPLNNTPNAEASP